MRGKKRISKNLDNEKNAIFVAEKGMQLLRFFHIREIDMVDAIILDIASAMELVEWDFGLWMFS